MKRTKTYRSLTITTYLVLNLVIIVTILLFNYHYTERILSENLGSNITTSLNTASEQMQFEMNAFDSMVNFVANDEQVVEIMKWDLENYPRRNFDDAQYLYTTSNSLMANLPIRVPLHFINYENNISRFSTTNYYAPYYKTSRSDFFQQIKVHGFEDVVGQPHWRVDGLDSLDVCYSIGRLIVDNDYHPVGYVVLDIYQYYFNQAVDSINVPKEANVLIVDKSGIVLADRNQEFAVNTPLEYTDLGVDEAYNDGFRINMNDSNYIAFSSDLEDVPFYTIAILPENFFTKSTLFSIRVFLPLAAISLALGVVISIWLSSIVSNPVQELSTAFREINKGNLSARVSFHGNRNELEGLGRDFNYMAASLEKLIEQEYKNSLLLQEAELSMLKSQINPHFLYNCMNMINMAAHLDETEEISKMSVILSQLFRYVLSDPEKEVSLREELQQVENYLDIYKIRYKDRLDVEISAPTELLHQPILKMMIQPLVENAMIHGIEQKVEKGIVKVIVESAGDYILIHVMDNGAGFGTSTEKGESIGLENVRRRIDLYYGGDSCLEIGRENDFTRVTIKVKPVNRKEPVDEGTNS